MAPRPGTHWPLGLFLEVAGALLLSARRLPFAFFIGGFALYGIGLGAVDASGAIQGVLVHDALAATSWRISPPAAGAAIVGALAVAAAPALGLPVGRAAASGRPGRRGRRGRRAPALRPVAGGRAGRDPHEDPAPPAGIGLFGFVILAAFTLDSGVSTWSTVYLHDDLLAPRPPSPRSGTPRTRARC